ncbi:MAG: transcriptional regulator [Flavobacteriaceae bacterium]|nr:transcriptional regulator [Flavobacteriaceae bacterium]|tara:strand:- start:269 stop:1399 length:1131 start_codon:yes stop_codon:yes gene_type:complete
MKSIKMVDLKGQYDAIKGELDIAMDSVLKTTSFINGPAVKEFQNNLQEYLNVKHVIPCANGTDALQLALMSLNLNPGDEIITSDFTFASTAEVVLLMGLKLKLVDINEETFNIDPLSIERAITSKTKAIIPVHLFGQTAEMEKIVEIAKLNNLKIIEDNAQALGATYTFNNGSIKKAGTIGDIGTTSFFPSKNLGAYGDGGAIYTDDDILAQKMRKFANHGMDKRYYHDLVGLNSRLDSIQAAILDVKLKYLDNYNERRRNSALRYSNNFKGISNVITPNIPFDPQSHVFHQYTLRILGSKRDLLAEYLTKNSIPFGIYYPVPLHNQKAYYSPEVDNKFFPVTNRAVNEVVSLPMHTELSNDQIDYISEKIIKFLN